MKAERWDEKHWNDTDHARTGRGRDTVMLMLNHAQNHLWREVWPAGQQQVQAYDNGDYTGYPQSGALYRGAALGY